MPWFLLGIFENVDVVFESFGMNDALLNGTHPWS
jgi:hypothetical protein